MTSSPIPDPPRINECYSEGQETDVFGDQFYCSFFEHSEEVAPALEYSSIYSLAHTASTSPFCQSIFSISSPLPCNFFVADDEIMDMSSLNLNFTPPQGLECVSPRKLHLPVNFEIPQRVYKSPSCFNRDTGKKFWFSIRNGTLGFPLSAALDRLYTDLDDRDDPLPLNSSGTSISIRVEWPGYGSWTRQIKSRDWKKVQSPIPKSKVTTEIGKVLERFVGVMQDQPQQQSEWRVGAGFIEARDLILVGLTQVSRSSYQPIIHFAP